MGLSPAQLAQRLEGITATDVSAIVGVNPHRSRIQVWQQKRGEAPPWVDTDRSRWGELLEPVVRADYGQRHELRVEVPGTLAHPDRPWMMSTPDGIAYRLAAPTPERGLEIKCHTWRVAHLYGRPGTDEIPLWEVCQCAWNQAVTGLARWDLVAFIDGQPTDYVIDRDDELIAGLIEQCERFLVDNVRGGAVPEPDGTEQFTDWLTTRWKANPGALIELRAEDYAHVQIARAKEIRALAADLEKEHEAIIQALKLKIGEHEGLTWSNDRGKPEKITWKRNKPSRRTDYATLAGDARADARLAMSAVAETIDRARVCLASLGHDQIGSSSRATITAQEVGELIHRLATSLVGIIERTDAKYTNEQPGNRPFCFPKTWKAPASAKEQ